MDKYDRQIRLWSKSGQKALQKARILILGIQTCTTEMAKCLALAGLHHMALCDGRRVTETDLASNFFIQPADLGKPIAPLIAASLAELNPDIEIEVVAESAESSAPEYDLVVVSSGTTARLASLNTTVVELCSRGFYGRVRSFYPQFTSYETHPASLVDLRLDPKWPELRAYLEEIVLEEPGRTTPYAAILGKTPAPASLEEQRSLKAEFLAKAEAGGENWREAAQNIYRYKTPALPSSLLELFPLVEENLGKAPFWSLVAATRDFAAKTNTAPLSGVLPDMAADTASYTALQQVYRAKALADVAEITQLLQKYPNQGIDQEIIRTFCKNARHLLAIDGQTPAANTRLIEKETERAHFRSIFEALEAASSLNLWAPDAASAARFGVAMAHPDQTVQNEIARSGGGELNAIATIIGGIAAQEVTKLILRHYSPLRHTLVYDGTTSDSAVF